MRRDIYTAALISLGLHYGLASFNFGKTEKLNRADDGQSQGCDFPPAVQFEEVVLSESEPSTPTHRDPTNAALRPTLPQIVGQMPASAIAFPVAGSLKPDFGRVTGDLLPKSIGLEAPAELGALDDPPLAKFQANPVYPFEMRRNGESGEVVVDFVVDHEGNVRNAFVVRSSRSEFENAAVDAVRKWKFRPGKKGGRNVSTHMQVPIRFSVESD